MTSVPSLYEALLLADHVSPSPAQAREALRVLRQALADSVGIGVDELIERSAGTPAGRI